MSKALKSKSGNEMVESILESNGAKNSHARESYKNGYREAMSIGQLSKKANVSNRTVRYYEELGLIVPQHRGSNRYRYYDDSHVDRLRLIKMLQESGFALKEIVGALNPILDPQGNITYSGLEMSRKIFDSLSKHKVRLEEKQIELQNTLDAIDITLVELGNCFNCGNSNNLSNCANCSSGPAEIISLGRRVVAAQCHEEKKAD